MNNETNQLEASIAAHAIHGCGRPWAELKPYEQLQSVILAVRDRAAETAASTTERIAKRGVKCAYYLSLECLIGRLLGSTLLGLGLTEQCAQAVNRLGGDLAELVDLEPDAGLGNGGLGRLAACLLDSLATLDMPAFGYTLNYEYGLFRQAIVDGRQVEQPDDWMRHGAPWEMALNEDRIPIALRGRVEWSPVAPGSWSPRWVDAETIVGKPFDIPIAGYGGTSVTFLRLFSATAPENFDMRAFNEGHYIEAMHRRDLVETITKVLYPNDSVPHGPDLRLVQEYFLTACALADILRRLPAGVDLRRLPDHAAIQLNDTHPSLAVAELMRLLVDNHGLTWDDAWRATVGTLGFTNHTLMPEALERWPVRLLEHYLPRHLEIIYEINRRFLEAAGAAYPGDGARLARMSLIEEGPDRRVRMANLAIVGSHSVNGVAEVHSELIRTSLVPDLYAFMPGKFRNITNGVTPRRWVRQCNGALSALVSDLIGDGWVRDFGQISLMEPHAGKREVQDRFLAASRENKLRLSEFLGRIGIAPVDPDSLINVQIKRIHEYKRQLLHLLFVVHRYLEMRDGAGSDAAEARAHIFAGKAAPGYDAAKEIIALIVAVGAAIDRDPRSAKRLRLIFVPDYRVTVAEAVIPAADIGEQISTAGTEASGTSNMKLAMNGALTVGTYDGANIEIEQHVGATNLFLFGNHVEQIAALSASRTAPRTFYDGSARIRRIMDCFLGDTLSPGSPGRFAWVYEKLVSQWDPWFHLADLDAYIDAQDAASALFADRREWARRALLNVARSGFFSSDRTAGQYAGEVWNIAPCPP